MKTKAILVVVLVLFAFSTASAEKLTEWLDIYKGTYEGYLKAYEYKKRENYILRLKQKATNIKMTDWQKEYIDKSDRFNEMILVDIEHHVKVLNLLRKTYPNQTKENKKFLENGTALMEPHPKKCATLLKYILNSSDESSLKLQGKFNFTFYNLICEFLQFTEVLNKISDREVSLHKEMKELELKIKDKQELTYTINYEMMRTIDKNLKDLDNYYKNFSVKNIELRKLIDSKFQIK